MSFLRVGCCRHQWRQTIAQRRCWSFTNCSPIASPASLHQCLSFSNSTTRRDAGKKTKRQISNTKLIRAVKMFYEQEAHFAIPRRFVVPSSSSSHHHRQNFNWPPELHELPLGGKIHRLMQSLAKGTGTTAPANIQLLAQLQAIGFPVLNWKEYWFDQVFISAMQTYQELEGDAFVPQKFVVPYGDMRWPRTTWGYNLGVQVAAVRTKKQRNGDNNDALSTDQIERLDAIGFVWNVLDAKWHRYFLPGLRHFKEIHGHTDIPLQFVVPKDGTDAAKWPTHLRGYMLGRHVYMVRSGKYATQAQESMDELDALGFSFSHSEAIWTQSIFPSLQVFAQLYDHCDVHQDFVVPAQSPWPTKAWGLKLGVTVKNIRQGAYESQVQAARVDLERLGFVWDTRQRLEKTVCEIIAPAIKAYEKLHGDVLVSTDFVVPMNDAVWPVRARGFKLGNWITRVRSGQINLPAYLKKELDAVGFVWQFTDARWRHVLLPSFRAYAQLHGSCRGMSTKFHVPHEHPYPRQAWGANLGGAMWHMRNGDTYVHDSEKQRELRELGVL